MDEENIPKDENHDDDLLDTDPERYLEENQDLASAIKRIFKEALLENPVRSAKREVRRKVFLDLGFWILDTYPQLQTPVRRSSKSEEGSNFKHQTVISTLFPSGSRTTLS